MLCQGIWPLSVDSGKPTEISAGAQPDSVSVFGEDNWRPLCECGGAGYQLLRGICYNSPGRRPWDSGPGQAMVVGRKPLDTFHDER
jgi:hypothetical protein